MPLSLAKDGREHLKASLPEVSGSLGRSSKTKLNPALDRTHQTRICNLQLVLHSGPHYRDEAKLRISLEVHLPSFYFVCFKIVRSEILDGEVLFLRNPYITGHASRKVANLAESDL